MRTMHLIREQVGCTVHVKKGRRKRKKKGPKLLRCSFFIFGHLFNKFCLCWPAHVLFSARIWYPFRITQGLGWGPCRILLM